MKNKIKKTISIKRDFLSCFRENKELYKILKNFNNEDIGMLEIVSNDSQDFNFLITKYINIKISNYSIYYVNNASMFLTLLGDCILLLFKGIVINEDQIIKIKSLFDRDIVIISLMASKSLLDWIHQYNFVQKKKIYLLEIEEKKIFSCSSLAKYVLYNSDEINKDNGLHCSKIIIENNLIKAYPKKLNVYNNILLSVKERVSFKYLDYLNSLKLILYNGKMQYILSIKNLIVAFDQIKSNYKEIENKDDYIGIDIIEKSLKGALINVLTMVMRSEKMKKKIKNEKWDFIVYCLKRYNFFIISDIIFQIISNAVYVAGKLLKTAVIFN